MTDEVKTEEVKKEVTETKQASSPEPAYVITKEELDQLVGTVKAKAPVDEKAVYEKAMAEARKEFETAQKSRLDELTRKAESDRIAKLEAELASVKEAAAGAHTRKGVSNTTNPFQKSEDGKLGIRRDALEEATKRMLNPNAR